MVAGFQAIVLAASTPNWLLLCIHRFRHHGGMVHGGGVATEGGIGAGGEVFCLIRFLVSINHGGRRHRPMAATVPPSRLLSIQQSTNILCNMTTLLKLEKVIINYVY